ncbi:MAG: hypothetical protein AAF411_01180 [Myxococcota bacterium]
MSRSWFILGRHALSAIPQTSIHVDSLSPPDLGPELLATASFDVVSAYEVPMPRGNQPTEIWNAMERVVDKLSDVVHGVVVSEDLEVLYTSKKRDTSTGDELQRWTSRLIAVTEYEMGQARKKRSRDFMEKARTDPAMKEANDWSDVKF